MLKKDNDSRYTNHEIDHVFNKIELVDLHACRKPNVKRKIKPYSAFIKEEA